MQPPFVEPTPAPVIHQECPIQCPQGPPGRDVSVITYIHCIICTKHISIYFFVFSNQGNWWPQHYWREGRTWWKRIYCEKKLWSRKVEHFNIDFDLLQGAYGEKGEKGEPGLIITRNEGESHSFGELDIREICSNVLKGKLIIFVISLFLYLQFFFQFFQNNWLAWNHR